MNNLTNLDKVVGTDTRKRATLGHINFLVAAINALPGVSPESDIILNSKKIKSPNGLTFIEVTNDSLIMKSGYISLTPTDFFTIQDEGGNNRINLSPGAGKFSYDGVHEFTGTTRVLTGLGVNTISSINGTQTMTFSDTHINMQVGNSGIGIYMSTTAITLSGDSLTISNAPVETTGTAVYIKNASGKLAEITIADLKILLA